MVWAGSFPVGVYPSVKVSTQAQPSLAGHFDRPIQQMGKSICTLVIKRAPCHER
jgi:hypothetical protein